MRIFQSIHTSTNVRVPGNQTWHRNLYEPLLDLGHEVVLVSNHLENGKSQRKDVQARKIFSTQLVEKFQQEHRKRPFQLFFSYFIDGMIEPEAIDEIRNSGVATCNFSCNNAHQFYLIEQLSPHFDFNLHTEKDAAEKFRAIQANPLWWPMASNPKYFHPLDVPRSIPVSFVGENYAQRARYVAHLLQNGINVHAYGPAWQFGTTSQARSIGKRLKYLLLSAFAGSSRARLRASAQLAEHDFRIHLAADFPANMHAPVSDEELIALYSRSHISLGVLEVFERHDPSLPVVQHLHLREFEAPMSGALYCTGYSDELTEFYEPDREILTYRNSFELLDKVRFYLNHPDQAEQIRAAGHARALREHTYHHRYAQLFRTLGLT
jgi:spore maturation protein CgeB